MNDQPATGASSANDHVDRAADRQPAPRPAARRLRPRRQEPPRDARRCLGRQVARQREHVQRRVPGPDHALRVARHLGPARPRADDAAPAGPRHDDGDGALGGVRAALPGRDPRRRRARDDQGSADAGRDLLRRAGRQHRVQDHDGDPARGGPRAGAAAVVGGAARLAASHLQPAAARGVGAGRGRADRAEPRARSRPAHVGQPRRAARAAAHGAALRPPRPRRFRGPRRARIRWTNWSTTRRG